ncbi:MAG: UvrD-helicase domain-containing protein [Polyangiaceae bacterium]|nr:UvrD-helicase domain-containing protein [Polyangiaceae bacterium]
MTRLEDAEARRRIENDLDATFLVEAAAGTGKTTSLVRRVVATIGAGADIAKLVAVTFTDKAAGELVFRLRDGLERAKASASGAERAAYTSALGRLEEAHVKTIHRFSADLVRARPVEAGVDPHFSALSQAESTALFEEAFGGWLEAASGRSSPALLRVFSRSDGAVEQLRRSARDLMDLRHLDAPWRRRPFDVAAEARAVLAKVEALAAHSEAARSRTDRLFVALAPERELAKRARRLDEERLEAALVALATRSLPDRLGSGAYGPGVDRAELLAELGAVREALAAFARGASADLAVSLREELMEAVRAYDALKARRGVLDFDDLLLRARDVLRDDPEVLAERRLNLGPFFVDEFQDTDPIQAQILLLLSGEGDALGADPEAARIGRGRLFVVGDPKQSIYRFRHADPGTYEIVRRLVLRSGGEVLQLGVSFRSVPGVLDFVNAAFEPVMRRDERSQQASYVTLHPSRPRVDGAPPAVMAIPIPEPYGRRMLAKGAAKKSLPAALAGFVAWLLDESGRTLVDPHTGAAVPIAPRHVAILLRSMSSYGVLDELTKCLSRAGVPYVVAGRADLAGQDESHAVTTALSAIEAPDDPLLVYATLRGLLFGLSDETLFEWSLRYGPLKATTLPRTAVPQHLGGVLEALLVVSELHRLRNARPYAETLASLLHATRAHVGMALAPSAEQAFLQLAAIEQIAASQERRGKLSFGSFVDALSSTADARAPAVEDAVDDERGGVRIMTVHGAKGLEFPVVVVGDPLETTSREPTKVVDVARRLGAMKLAECAPWDLIEARDDELARQAAELTRLAYVAATRARDILAFPVIGDDVEFPRDGWLRPLSHVLAPSAPTDGIDVVLNRPDSVERPARSLCAGTQQTPGGEVLIVDPRWLGVSRKSPLGVREDLVSKQADPALVEADVRAFEAAASARSAAIATGTGSPRGLVTVTALSKGGASSAEDPVAVELHQTQRAPDRPRGKRFGTLVHFVLSTVGLDAQPDEIDALTSSLARLDGHSPADVEAAAHAARAALQHPLVRRAALSGSARRELPVTLALADGRTADGVVDLVFEDDGQLVVVDYKTDDPAALLPEHLAGYRAQVGIYARALERATGKRARMALLFV